MVLKKKDKEIKKLKEFAEYLSGRKVEFQVKEKSITMLVNGKFLCGFTGTIKAEDYRKEKAALDKREKKIQKVEKQVTKIINTFKKKMDKIGW